MLLACKFEERRGCLIAMDDSLYRCKTENALSLLFTNITVHLSNLVPYSKMEKSHGTSHNCASDQT
jgi:hypothetical protein